MNMLNKKNLNKLNLFLILKVCILSLPSLWGFFLVLHYGVNLCFWDEWSYAFLFESFKNGTLTVADIFRQHNEHRMFLPNLVTLVTGLFTDMNSKAFMFVSMCFLTVGYIYILRFLKAKIQNESQFIIMSFLIGFTLFHSAQYENILWGFQTAWFMIAASSIICFYAFTKLITNPERFAKNLIIFHSFALIASFSSLHGLFIWLSTDLILFILFLKKSLPNKYVVLSILFVEIFAFILYFYGYSKPAGHPKLMQSGIISAVKYYLLTIGQIASHKYKIAYLSGMTVLALSSFFVFYSVFSKSFLNRNIFPLGLIIFGNIFVASIAVGRSGFGIGQAFASRYVTNIVLIVIGLVLCTYDIFLSSKKSISKVFATTVLFISFIFILKNPFLLGVYQDSKISKIKDAFGLTKFSEINYGDYPSLAIIASGATYENNYKIIKENQWNVYSEAAVKSFEKEIISVNALPNYEILNKNFSFNIDYDIHNENYQIISGWAFYEDDDYDLFIKSNGLFFKAARTHRGDAQATFNKKTDLLGFTVFIKNPSENYYLYFVNKTKKEIYTNDTLELKLPNYDSSDFNNQFYIDVESDTLIRGWALVEKDDYDFFLESDRKTFRAEKELRPDVAESFNINNNNLGFIIHLEKPLLHYNLYLADYSEKRLYLIMEK